MATRTSIRPRPVDLARPLTIVRDVAELDKSDDLDPSQAPEQAAPSGHPPKKKKEVKEIPVPEVRYVPGYTREYLPLFRIPETYIRGKGGIGWARDDYVEYDLDNEDEDWLEKFNADQPRLPDEKFEAMLYRLELVNAESNQHLMSEPGATDWRMLPAAVATISNLQRSDAIAMLRKYVGGRESTLQAVYDYWKGKRERWGKPMLRRIQAPTNPNDTNPYNVFRPRERVNRPQTRRRRENTQDCLEKMKQIRESMLKALEMTELLVFREARKRDIIRLDVDMQRYQIARHHRPRQQQEAVEAEAAAQLHETQARSKQGEARLRAYLDGGGALGVTSVSYDGPLHRALLRKRRRQDLEGSVNQDAVSRLPPPPPAADDEMLLLYTPDLARLTAPGGGPQQRAGGAGGSKAGSAAGPLVSVPPSLDLRCVRPRVSRCGRLMLTRCDPLTMEPHAPLGAPADGEAPTSSSGANNAAGCGGHHEPGSSIQYAYPAGLASRHPLLHSAQQPSVPWAALLDINLLPEGIVDKAALKQQRERRLHADRNNVVSLRQTQLQLQQAAAGGMMGGAGLAGAAAAAAAAAVTAAVGASGAAAGANGGAPAAGGSTPGGAGRPPPPPPPGTSTHGAPAGTTPHVAHHAPAGALPHSAGGGVGGPGSAAASPSGAGPQGAGAAAGTPAAPGGSGGSQGAVRKVPKTGQGATPGSASGAAGAAAARSPPQGGAALAGKQAAGGPAGRAGRGDGYT